MQLLRETFPDLLPTPAIITALELAIKIIRDRKSFRRRWIPQEHICLITACANRQASTMLAHCHAASRLTSS